MNDNDCRFCLLYAHGFLGQQVIFCNNYINIITRILRPIHNIDTIYRKNWQMSTIFFNRKFSDANPIAVFMHFT